MSIEYDSTCTLPKIETEVLEERHRLTPLSYKLIVGYTLKIIGLIYHARNNKISFSGLDNGLSTLLRELPPEDKREISQMLLEHKCG